MDDFFKSQLPTPVASLVDRIENFAGREIVVAVDTRSVSPTDPNPDRLATEVTEQSAIIFIRARDSFPSHGVLHELLHIERFWIEGVPQVLPLHDENGERLQVTSSIENALEHQIIVPREADYGFEPYGYWNETERRLWSQYPWPSITTAWARRKNFLLGWLTVSKLVTDSSVKDHAECCLRKEGLLDEAQKFAVKIAQTIDSKPRAISAVLRFLNIPVQDIELVKFDVVREKRISIPIPAY
jgi:hypothetical protein